MTQEQCNTEPTLGGVPRPLGPAAPDADEGVLVEGLVLAARVRGRVADRRPRVPLCSREGAQDGGRNGDETEPKEHRVSRRPRNYVSWNEQCMNVKEERVNFPYALTMARDARAIAPAVGGIRWTVRSTWAFAVDHQHFHVQIYHTIFA